MKKQLYFAPLEGITGYTYRNAHKRYFGNIDKYYIPFLVTNQNGKLKSKEHKDILPENNEGMYAVPQILSNHAEQFILMAKQLEQLGYEELNLNLGCPARTVVTKKKGSGLLAYPDELERFLDEIYNGIHVKLSIKTRIGLELPEEFDKLLRIYNQYPVKELIIHPRVQKDFYNNRPNMEVFRNAMKESVNPICYNGDIFTKDDFEVFQKDFPEVDSIMLGRGLLRNPGLADEIHGMCSCKKETLKAFHDELCEGYQEIMSGDRNVLFKMKEIWFYMSNMFEHPEKYMKEIRKASKLCDYQEIVERLFVEQKLK